jgi:hypothetical protein
MKENIMFDQPALLLVVIAIVIAAVWLLDRQSGARFGYSDWPKQRPDSRRHFAYTLAMREPARMHPGGNRDAQDVIRRLHQESGSY